ncbi:MAG: Gfo/Idh/MocA family oxidoreductase [Oscillospiraceae bacterium]|nr:Gfo/Idh/MocA family oxidoreductase [Oscillospiraceae bacterium]
MKKVRFGILGAGGIADRRTLPGMLLAGHAEITAVMELDSAVAESLRVKYGAKRAYTDEAALCADPEIDAVYIASPITCHARQARLAADNGKHILIEKPLAMTADEGAAIVAYCREKGVKMAAGLMMRFGAYVQAMKQAIAEGKIGDVVSCFAHFTGWFPDMPGNWRQSKATAGGGALTDMGVHCVDLIRYVTGQEVRQVAAMHDTMTFRYDVEDSSVVLLRLENGTLATVQSNFNIPDDASLWRLEFFGTKGRMAGNGVIGQIDGGTVDAVFVEDAGGYDAEQSHEGKTAATELEVEFGNMYTREIESFCLSILENKPLEVPAEEAVTAQRLIEAAYRANDEGRTIDMM